MAVPDGLLFLLESGPRHGYQLAAEFTEHTAGRWKINTGQVYTTLDRLARDGYVEDDGVDPDDARRRRYRLTRAGAERVETWLAAPPPAPADQRDELVLRVLLTVAVRPADAMTVIATQRRALIERLQRIRREMRARDDDLVERMATDAAATRVEADLAWLDRCEERLRSAALEATTAENPS
ncbi:MAG TPA: helix-turn-helix transcriptional regulator [Acidimicrobiales bacterium]|nr:helix-turn-helix transcriptional regulator [Acidimicrobiales bacterium]